MRTPVSGWAVSLAIALLATACGNEDGGVAACASHDDCGAREVCQQGVCVVDSDNRRQRGQDAGTDLGGQDGPAVDSLADGLTDGACQPDCSGRECGPDPICGIACGPDCSGGASCDDGVCVADGEPLGNLSTECAGFCTALCEFLLECGKNDPTCLATCGASPRFQALSTTACNEGAAVIGLESCPLWLDCGGQACGIDEMCLEVIPGLSYSCAPICDHTQATPACPGGDPCQTVTDAASNVMSALGMCFSLF